MIHLKQFTPINQNSHDYRYRIIVVFYLLFKFKSFCQNNKSPIKYDQSIDYKEIRMYLNSNTIIQLFVSVLSSDSQGWCRLVIGSQSIFYESKQLRFCHKCSSAIF